MRRIEINMDLADVDDDGVFQNQTLGGAGNFTLNGAEVTSGEWVTPDLFAKQIGFTSTGNISGVTFTVSGYLDKNKTIPITETNITGPNNNTVETTNYFYSIQSVSASEAVGTNTKAGSVDEAVSQIISIKRTNSDRNERQVGLTFIVTGTINYTVQQTSDDVQSLTDRTFNWLDSDDSAVVAATTSKNSNYIALPQAMRVKINSYSSGAALLIQVN
jgi:hypothetical protein